MRRVDLAADARHLKLLSRSDARQQQELGRADRAGAQDHLPRGVNRPGLAGGVLVFDTGGDGAPTFAFEQHPGRPRAGDDRQIGTLLRLAGEEGLIGARSAPVPRRELCQGCDTARRIAVAAVVVAPRDAGGDRRLDELPRRRQDRVAHRHAERPLCIVCGLVNDDLGARRQPLAFLEIGEHLRIAPAGGTALGPGIEVAGITTHVHHVIDAGRAAEHLATRHRHTPTIEPEPGLARIGRVHPIRRRIERHRRRRDRQRGDLRRPLARLDQCHPARWILGETRRDDRARGAAAHDDEVEFLGHFGLPVRVGPFSARCSLVAEWCLDPPHGHLRWVRVAPRDRLPAAYWRP